MYATVVKPGVSKGGRTMIDNESIKRITLSEAELPEFVKALESCEKNVYLVTNEGDRINLKSQFCRMIGLYHIINGGKFAGGHIECESTDDAARLFRFNLFGVEN